MIMKCNKAHHILGAKVYEKKVAITDVNIIIIIYKRYINKLFNVLGVEQKQKQTVKQYSTRKKTKQTKSSQVSFNTHKH